MNGELITTLYQLQEWLVSQQVGNKVVYLIGLFLFLAWVVVLMVKRVRIPVIVGYIFLGVLINVELVEHLPFLSEVQSAWYGFIIDSFDYIPQVALAFVAFTIGSEISVKVLKRMGQKVWYIVFFEALAAFGLVVFSLFIFGQPLYRALLLGSIAVVSSPAATVMVLREYEAEGRLTSMVLAVVAIDAVLALILFSLVEPIALMLYRGEANVSVIGTIGPPLFKVFLSLGLGFITGYFTQRLIAGFEDKTKKVLTMLVAVVGTSALALFLDLAPLIANMMVGFVYRNFTRKNLGIADYLETLTIPLYALFFIRAGTKFRFSVLVSVSFLVVAAVYVITRLVGKFAGAYLGAYLSGASDNVRKYIGLALFSQSGIAIALAYAVQRSFEAPEVGTLIFNILLFAVILSELFGPLATKHAVFKAGEARESSTGSTPSRHL